jgi:hypothetical protein
MSASKDLGRFGSVGIELLLSLGVGYYGGRYLDRKFAGGHGYITAACIMLAIFSVVRMFYKLIVIMQREAEREQKTGGDPLKDDSYDSEYLEAVDRDQPAADASSGVTTDDRDA